MPAPPNLTKPEVSDKTFRFWADFAPATPKKDGAFAQFAAGPGFTNVVSGATNAGARAQAGRAVQNLPERR